MALGFRPLASAPLAGYLSTADVAVAISGVSASLSVGSLAVQANVPLTSVPGITDVGSFGLGLSVAISGELGTGAVGTVTYNANADLSLSLNGEQSNGSVGTLTPNIEISLSGVSASCSVGDVATQTTLSGNESSCSVGSFGINITLNLSGVTCTGYPGTMSVSGGVSSGQFVHGISDYPNTDGITRKTHDDSGNETSSISVDKTDSISKAWWVNG